MAPDDGASTVMTQCPFLNNHPSVETFTAPIVFLGFVLFFVIKVGGRL